MRNYLRAFIVGLGLASTALAAAVFSTFGPANGILVGTTSSASTTAATSANVIGLWSGTCNSGSFLRGDGSCQAAGGAQITNRTAMVLTCTGFASCPVTAGHYTIVGSIVCINIDAASGTSNATGFTITLPTSILFPQDQVSSYTNATDNGTDASRLFRITNAGVIQLFATTTAAGVNTWTNTGTKGLTQNLSICYNGPNA